jgi:hypothetical protein
VLTLPSATVRSVDAYEIRIRGRLTPALVARFEGMSSELAPVDTVLHGPLEDQAALHGVIELIRALGLDLVDVRKLPAGRPSADQPGPSSSRSRARRTALRRSGTSSLR